MYKVDAKGLSCPEPVILTMNAVKAGNKEISVELNDRVPVENVTRYAKSQGFTVKETKENDVTTLLLTK